MSQQSTDKTENKQNKPHLFQPGVSGNPKGRPQGSRCKATLLAEGLMDGQAEAIVQRIVEIALDGDATALKACLDRILPPRKDRPVQISLPEMNKPEDIVQSLSKVIQAASEGEITPAEASTLAKVLGEQAKAIETQDHESRIVALENKGSRNANTR